MLKKVIPIVIVLCLIFSVSAIAENENIVVEESAPKMSEQIPQNTEEIPQDGRNMDMQPSDGMPGRIPPNMTNGEMPPEGMNTGQRSQRNFTPPQNADEFTPQQGEVTSMQNNDEINAEVIVPQTDGNESAENPQITDGNQEFGGQTPGGRGGFPGNMQNFNIQTQEEQPKGFLGFVKTYSTPITSVIILGLAFVFVIFYRRKNY